MSIQALGDGHDMQLDFTARELTIKLVYYGPALSGKTTNLQSLHAASVPEATGRLMTLETRDDRTLFFDLLPLTFTSARGLSVRLKVFTVPGQVIHASTRRLVLQGADGVAFIADSRDAETEHNAESYRDLRENLKQNGLTAKQLPLVLQFNKRDLPNVRAESELSEMASQGPISPSDGSFVPFGLWTGPATGRAFPQSERFLIKDVGRRRRSRRDRSRCPARSPSRTPLRQAPSAPQIGPEPLVPGRPAGAAAAWRLRPPRSRS